MKIRSIVLILLAVLPAAAVLATGASEGSSAGLDGRPLVTGMSVNHLPSEPDPDNQFWAKVAELTGYETDITWVPVSAYAQRFAVVLAAGDLPEFMTVMNIKDQAFTQAAEAGAFWDLTDELESYPNIMRLITDAAIINSQLGGRNYGIPRGRPVTRQGLIYRKDVVQGQFGIDRITTFDEFVQVAELMTDVYPRGIVTLFDSVNGINDAITLASVWLGGPRSWGYLDGELANELFHPQYREALDLYRRFYEIGVLDEEFVLMGRDDDTFVRGDAGLNVGFTSAVNRFFAPVTEGLGGTLDAVQVLEGPAGMRAMAESGFAGIQAISRSQVRNEEDLDRVMTFFDRLSGEAVTNLFWWGFEGTHHAIEGGLPTRPGELNEAYRRDIQMYRQLQMNPEYDAVTLKGTLAPSQTLEEIARAEAADYVVLDPTVPFVSETNTEVAATLATIKTDMVTKYIIGEIDWDGFVAQRDEWLRQGGARVTQEFADQIAAARR